MMIGQRPARGFDPYMPPLDMGTPQQPFGFDVPPVAMPQAAPQTAKPNKIVNWAGLLADVLAGAMGRPGQFAQSMRQEKAEQSALERGEQQYQRRRMDDREDFKWRQQNEQRAPDEFTRLMDQAGIPPEQRAGMYGQMVQRKLNPPRTVVWADGTVMEIPSGPAPLVPQVPQRPVGPLTPVNGGPTAQPSGSFRPYYR